MNILEQALEHARKVAEVDPDRQAAIEAKRKMMDEKAREVYQLVAPLSGQLARYKGQDARVHVSLRPDRVQVILTARESQQRKDGSIQLVDTPNQIAKVEACGFSGGYTVRNLGGAEKSFAQIVDVVAFVAAEIGPLLLVEA